MRRYRTTLFKILVSALLLWFLVHTSKLDFRILPNLLNTPLMLSFTILVGFTTMLISARRWYLLNHAQGISIPYTRTILPTYLGIAFNNLLPGGVGGDFYRCYYLFKKITDNKSTVMLSILIDRITGLMGIFIAVCFTSIFHLEVFRQQQISPYFILLPVCVCVTALSVFFASTLLPQEIGLSLWLTNRHSNKKWVKSVISLLNALRIYRNSKATILKCLAISFVVQMIIAATCLLIAKMLHFPPISFFDFILAIAVAQIISLIPISPGGFGIGEVAFANVLTLLNPGIAASYATIFLGYRIINIIPYLPGLIVFAFDGSLFKRKMGNSNNDNLIQPD